TRADAAARASAAAAASAAEATPEPIEAEELVPLEEADAEENTGKVKAVVPESEDDIEIDETIEDDDDDDSTFIADEEEGDEDVADIIGDVGGDEET
ncbi:TIGR02300 family protein, partial [Bradyrhizobium sp.]|uniref:TIGR02300 family protein n=1 Tax=Bradyrhizobium sp. TaxID=376 RepID=UPI003C72B28B